MSTSQGFQPQQEFQTKIKRKLKENSYNEMVQVFRAVEGAQLRSAGG
jgi:hypothetical protein